MEKFERWVEIEERMMEMGKQIERLQKIYQVQSKFSRVQTWLDGDSLGQVWAEAKGSAMMSMLIQIG